MAPKNHCRRDSLHLLRARPQRSFCPPNIPFSPFSFLRPSVPRLHLFSLSFLSLIFFLLSGSAAVLHSLDIRYSSDRDAADQPDPGFSLLRIGVLRPDPASCQPVRHREEQQFTRRNFCRQPLTVYTTNKRVASLLTTLLLRHDRYSEVICVAEDDNFADLA